MDNKVEKALNKFAAVPETEEAKPKNNKAKEVVLNEREGLIERVDKLYVTSDGRQLLREQY